MKKQSGKDLVIPRAVKVVFVLSNGKKYFLSPGSFKELGEIFSWMKDRLEEFQNDVNSLAAIDAPGIISVLEIRSDGSKTTLQDVKLRDYSLN